MSEFGRPSQYEYIAEALGEALGDAMARDSKVIEESVWNVIYKVGGYLAADNENFDALRFRENVESIALLHKKMRRPDTDRFQELLKRQGPR